MYNLLTPLSLTSKLLRNKSLEKNATTYSRRHHRSCHHQQVNHNTPLLSFKIVKGIIGILESWWGVGSIWWCAESNFLTPNIMSIGFCTHDFTPVCSWRAKMTNMCLRKYILYCIFWYVFSNLERICFRM